MTNNDPQRLGSISIYPNNGVWLGCHFEIRACLSSSRMRPRSLESPSESRLTFVRNKVKLTIHGFSQEGYLSLSYGLNLLPVMVITKLIISIYLITLSMRYIIKLRTMCFENLLRDPDCICKPRRGILEQSSKGS